jgi:secreted trypsin-like serine protease
MLLEVKWNEISKQVILNDRSRKYVRKFFSGERLRSRRYGRTAALRLTV